MKKFLFLLVFYSVSAFAENPCLKYATVPKANFVIRDYNVQVQQPDYSFRFSHGNVATELGTSYKFMVKTETIPGGQCISVTEVNMEMFYQDFIINIDKKYKPESCAYNIIYEHEKKHIDAYAKTPQKYKQKIESALMDAVKKVEPVYVADYKDVAIAQDKLYSQIIDNFQSYKIIEEISDEISKINDGIDSDMQNENALIQDCFKQEIQNSK